MRWVRISDGTITKVYRGPQIDKDDVAIPDNLDIRPGTRKAEYGPNWELRPLSQRVADGLIKLDPMFRLDGESLVRKAKAQLVREGLIKVPRGQKLEGDSLIEMTPDEKCAAGIISAAQAYEAKVETCLARRRNAYVDELDPIRYDLERARVAGDSKLVKKFGADYVKKDAEIRQRYPKP